MNIIKTISLVVGVLVSSVCPLHAKTNDRDSLVTVTRQKITVVEDAIGRSCEADALRAMQDIDLRELFKRYNWYNDEIAYELMSITHKASETFSESPLYGIFLLYEATVYYCLYNDLQWQSNKIERPILPYPEDITVWSGDQFNARMLQLVDEALSGESARRLNSLRTADYRDIMLLSTDLVPYFPTLLDCAYDYVLNRLAFKNDEKKAILDAALARVQPGTPEYMPLIVKKFAGKNDLKNLCGEFERYADSEYAGYLLIQIFLLDYNYGNRMLNYPIESSKWFCKQAGAYLEKYPEALFHDLIKQDILAAKQSDINCYFLPYWTKDVEMPLILSITNAEKVAVGIYKYPEGDPDDYETEEILADRKNLAKEIIIDTDSVAPFRCDTAVTVTVEEWGNYIVAVNDCSGKSAYKDYKCFQCKPVFPLIFDEVAEPKVMLLNPIDGAPIADACVQMMDADEYYDPETYGDTKTIITRYTDAAGVVTFDNLDDPPYVDLLKVQTGDTTAVFDGDDFYIDLEPSEEKDYALGVFTDKEIYDFGENMDITLALIWFTRDKHGNFGVEYVQNDTLEVTVRDPRGEIGVAKCIGDGTGKYYGEFLLPGKGVPGRYELYVRHNSRFVYKTKYITVKDSAFVVTDSEPQQGNSKKTPKTKQIVEVPSMDNPVPGTINLWVDYSDVECGRDESPEILYGVKEDGTYVHFVTFAPGAVLGADTRKVDKGYHTYKVAPLGNYQNYELWIFTVENNILNAYCVSIAANDVQDIVIEGIDPDKFDTSNPLQSIRGSLKVRRNVSNNVYVVSQYKENEYKPWVNDSELRYPTLNLKNIRYYKDFEKIIGLRYDRIDSGYPDAGVYTTYIIPLNDYQNLPM